MTENFSFLKKEFFKPLIFILLFVSFFLSMGIDSPGHVHARMYLAAGFIALCFLSPKDWSILLKKRHPTLFLFGLVFVYEVIRAVLPPGTGSRFALPPESADLYVKALLPWGIYFFGFAAVYIFLKRKSTVTAFLTVNAVAGFLISLNIILPLSRTGNINYEAQGQYYFFYPIFYAGEWVGKYLLAPYCHPNRAGDILSIGFFAALGILCYFLLQLRERGRTSQGYENKISRREWELFLFFGLFSLVTGTVILLLLSRGTIASGALVFFAAFFALAFKFPSKTQWAMLAGILTVFILFFLWAGNLKAVWKEVRSLEIENKVREADFNQIVYKSRSIFVNQEGARRALKIYEDYPLWGIGTQGYRVISKEYSSGKEYDKLTNADGAAWCHYLQLLAEEGMGAYIYFLFLIAWAFELFTGMKRTQSQFKFMASLSFAAPVFVIFIHASIIETMQRFTVALPVYLLMAASLAVLRKDFLHDE